MIGLARIAVLTTCLAAMSAPAQAMCRADPAKAAPLLELYTSEGCSSCPPADRWLSELVAAGTPLDVVPLSFHVDYWDYLGWKDRFASARYARRQRARVHAAGDRVVYTPQVMIGAETRLDWRRRAGLAEAAQRARASAPPVRLELQAVRNDAGFEVDVGAIPEDATATQGLRLELALYSDGLVSRVAAGENRDAVLQHDRVVRQWHGPWALIDGREARAKVAVVLPDERGAVSGVVAIVSDPARGDRTWALDLPLRDCR